MFADMVRIASLLVTKSLEVGYLVASVKVYGLLTEYKTGQYTPMAHREKWCAIFSTFTCAISMSPVLAQFTCAILYGVLYLAHADVLY